LQVDSFTFLPLLWDKGVLIAQNVPIYSRVMRKDERGKEFVDFDRDETGAPKILGHQSEVVIDTNVMADDTSVVKIPKGLAAKMDNERVQYTQAYRIASEFNKPGGWWNKWGHMLVTIIGIGVICVVVIFGFIKYGEMADKVAATTNAGVMAASANNLAAAKLNAQIADALLRLGFNYNATFKMSNSTDSPPVPSSGGQLVIPYLSG
jgi:hypothetical protein